MSPLRKDTYSAILLYRKKAGADTGLFIYLFILLSIYPLRLFRIEDIQRLLIGLFANQ